MKGLVEALEGAAKKGTVNMKRKKEWSRGSVMRVDSVLGSAFVLCSLASGGA